ncbi:sulfatase [Halopenitus persicus]|uniref:sulfatase n=1 Tax=Halopenitus persicus TaxID=1048396 RepID=UPI000BBB0B4D|nr:sulfatase [Halopenitus persicus]
MKPNIVFILLDTARASNLSCYGYDRETSPFIDSLADSGVRYDRAFANSIYSLPSYGSIFTGQYPSDHGAVDWNKRITENTLVEGLNDRGYSTHAVSTHLVSGDFGVADAFDSVDVPFVSSRDLPFDEDPVAEQMAEKANKEGFDSEREKYTYFLKTVAHHPSPKSLVNGAAQLYRKLRKDYGYWQDDGASTALDSARDIVRSADEPFFIFANFVETHDPYRPPRGYIREFMPDDVSFDEIRNALDYSSVRACFGLDEITDRDRIILQALYDAEIRYLDDQLREFDVFLRDEGVRNDTVLLILSDHGDFFGNADLWGHQGRVYNDVCHVPLIIDYPWTNVEVEGEVAELRQLCSHLQSVAEGDEKTLSPSGEAIVEYYGIDTQLSYEPWEVFEGVSETEWASYQVALVDDTYKLIWDATDRVELYDMQTDFWEITDLAADKQNVVEAYKKRLETMVGTPRENHDAYRAGSAGEERTEQSEAVQERLRELGYIE